MLTSGVDRWEAGVESDGEKSTSASLGPCAKLIQWVISRDDTC